MILQTDLYSTLCTVHYTSKLLYILSEMEDDAETTNIDEQLSIPVFEDATNITLPKTAIEQFQKENIDENQAQQRIFISRLDGVEERHWRKSLEYTKTQRPNLKWGLRFALRKKMQLAVVLSGNFLVLLLTL